MKCEVGGEAGGGDGRGGVVECGGDMCVCGGVWLSVSRVKGFG